MSRILKAYQLHLRRRRLQLRSFRKRHELTAISDRTGQISKNDIILMATLRNERMRVPYFLDYYRKLGVNHFILVDNGSEDGVQELLTNQTDVSVFHTGHSYAKARYGLDWINHLAGRYAHGHWLLVADLDEFFVYPFCDTRPLRALTDWLESADSASFGCLLVDLYPKGPLDAKPYREGDDPFVHSSWFDSGNYTIRPNLRYGNLWIQGGPRARTFFRDQPDLAPALNKIPLVRWKRGYVWLSSTHTLLPSRLNRVYDRDGGEQISGCLLHTKFLNALNPRAQEEAHRLQHFDNAREYRAYGATDADDSGLWTTASEKYLNWRQLEILGIMSKGNWA